MARAVEKLRDALLEEGFLVLNRCSVQEYSSSVEIDHYTLEKQRGVNHPDCDDNTEIDLKSEMALVILDYYQKVVNIHNFPFK